MLKIQIQAKQIYEGSDASIQLDASLLLPDLTFEYIGNNVDQSSISKNTLNTFFKGSEVAIAGNLTTASDADLMVRIRGKAGEAQFERDLLICVRSYDEYEKSIPILPHPGNNILSLLPAPRSDAQNFLKDLYAFLSGKQLLDEGGKAKTKKP